MSNSAPFFKAYLSNFQKYGCDAAVLLGHMTAQIAWHEQHHRQGAWYHSTRAIADELGMTRKRVRTALTKLTDAGELRIEKGVGPNRTDGFRLGQPVVPVGPVVATQVGPVGQRVGPVGQPNKQERKRKKSMHREMPACSSSIDRDCKELVEAIQPLELNDRDTLSLAKVAKAGGVTAQELNELVADVQSKNPMNAGGLLRVKLRGSDVQRLRSKQAEAHEADVRRRIEANADLLVDRLQQRFGVGAHFMAELDRKSGTYRLPSGHTFNLKVNSEVLVGQINSYKPSVHI